MDASLALLKKMAKASPAISACPEAQKHEAHKLAAIANGDLAATCALLHKQLLAMAAENKSLRAEKRSLEQKFAHLQDTFELIDTDNRRLWEEHQHDSAVIAHLEASEEQLREDLYENRGKLYEVTNLLDAEKAQAAASAAAATAALEAEKARNQEAAEGFLRKIASQSAQLRESYIQYDHLCDLYDALEREKDALQGIHRQPAAGSPDDSSPVAGSPEPRLAECCASASALSNPFTCRLATEEEIAALEPAKPEGLEAVLRALRCETPTAGQLGSWCVCCPSLSPIRAPKELSVPGAPRKAPAAEKSLYD